MLKISAITRKLIAVPAIAAITLAGGSLLSAAHASASGVINVHAYSDVVAISGAGLPAGDVIYITLVAPDGESFDLTNSVVADRAGTFETDVPTWQFRSAGIGYWTVDVSDLDGQGTTLTVFID